jgi:hypothetical protein
MLLFATLMSALVAIGLYVTLFLTMAGFGALNPSGQLLGRVALFVSGGTMLLALTLALTARNVTISSGALAGSGWFLAIGGIGLLFPGWAVSASPTTIPGLTGFGGIAGALFLILAGGLLLQAERTVRERNAVSKDSS